MGTTVISKFAPAGSQWIFKGRGPSRAALPVEEKFPGSRMLTTLFDDYDLKTEMVYRRSPKEITERREITEMTLKEGGTGFTNLTKTDVIQLKNEFDDFNLRKRIIDTYGRWSDSGKALLENTYNDGKTPAEILSILSKFPNPVLPNGINEKIKEDLQSIEEWYAARSKAKKAKEDQPDYNAWIQGIQRPQNPERSV